MQMIANLAGSSRSGCWLLPACCLSVRGGGRVLMLSSLSSLYRTIRSLGESCGSARLGASRCFEWAVVSLCLCRLACLPAGLYASHAARCVGVVSAAYR